MKFEQDIEKFKNGDQDEDRLVTYSVTADGKRGEPIKSWPPTTTERIKIEEAKLANTEDGRAIFEMAEPSQKR